MPGTLDSLPTRPPRPLFCENPTGMADRCSIVRTHLRMRLALLLILATPTVSAQDPVVHRIDMAAMPPGGTASVTVHGEQLQQARFLWTPFGTLTPVEGHDPAADKAVNFTGSLADDAALGISPARVVTATGCSEAVPVVIDTVPVAPLTGDSESPAQPQTASVPFALSGWINPVKPRYVDFELQAGQTIHVEAWARRLQSELDPVLVLSDAAGQEVAFCDDIPGWEGDAAFSFTAPSAGRWRLELRDVRYSGGGRHRFFLRVADSPLTQPLPGELNDALARPEEETNNTLQTATAVPPDARWVHAGFGEPGDVDWFRLPGTNDRPVCLTARTRDMGLPADIVLRLHDTSGALLSESDESGARDARIVHTVPAGDALLEVRELGNRGGPSWAYMLEIDHLPRLELEAAADHVTVPRGGSASLPITVHRIHLQEPVILRPTGLPAGITGSDITLAPGQSTVPLTLTAAADADNQPTERQPALTILPAVASGSPIRSAVFVTPPPRARPDGAFRSARLQNSLFCAAGPPPQFALTASAPELQVAPGNTAQIGISVSRHADWTEPIDVGLAVPADQLPPGVTVGTTQVANDAGSIDITVAADTAPQILTVFLQGTAKKDKTTVTHPVPPVVITVASPPQTAGAATSPPPP